MRFTKLGVFIILVCISPLSFAQEKVTIKKKEFKTDQKEGFKEAWKSMVIFISIVLKFKGSILKHLYN